MNFLSFHNNNNNKARREGKTVEIVDFLDFK